MLAQLSDPHIRLGEGEREAAEALAHAVAAVVALDPVPDAVLLTGDLANGGDGREYALVKELIAPLTMPVYAVPGNHDIAEPFAHAFGPPEFAVDVDDIRLVGVDTSIPGEDGGRIDLQRLDAHLEQSDRPTIVAMHHAPIFTGIPPMDAIGIRPDDVAGLKDLLARHPHVKRIVTGHVHRGITGTLGGVPVIACRSTHWQLELDFHATEIKTNDDPPGYALHLSRDGDITSHVVAL